MSLIDYRPSESPVAQMSVVAGLVASTAQALSLSFQEKSVLLRICQSFGSSVTYDVYRSVDGVVDSEPMVSGVSDAFYLSVVLGQENSILVLSLRAAGYYPILLTVSYLYEKDLLFISQVWATGEMKYKMFNSTELSQNLDYTIDSFTAVPDLSIDTLPKVIDFLSGFVTTDNLKQYIADQVDAFEVVQGPGNSTTAVMSQNAVTEELLQKVGVDAVVGTTGNSSNLVMSQASVTEELSKKASLESVSDGISAHNTSSTSHADIRELLNTCVGLPVYDPASYKITFTTLAGAFAEIDLPIEQLALRYNPETESIEFDNHDGTTTSIPVSAFVKEYVGSIGDRIQISIDKDNVIHATVLKNSIDWDCLSVELQERINDHVTSSDFATKVVRTDIAQSLSLSAQNQALENIGADLMIIDLVNGQATLTEEQEVRLLSCKGVILRGTVNAGTEVLTKIYFSDYQGGDQVSFWAVRNNRYILQCIYTKSTKLFRFLTSTGFIDPNAVSIKIQTLSATEQAQAFVNLGMKVYVTDSSFLGSTLSAEEIEQVVASKVLLFTDTGDFFLFGSADSSRVSFYRPANNYYINHITVSRSSGLVTGIGSYAYRDKDALHFTVENPALTSAQQEQAWSNLGLDLVVLKFPEGATSVTLTDEEDAKLLAGAAVLMTVDGTNTGSGVYNADNHIFTSFNFATASEPLYCSLWSYTSALYCSYKKASKTFVYNGSLQLNDTGAVRVDRQTSLTSAQQSQVFENLGWKVYVISESVIGSSDAVSDEEKAARLSATALLVQETGLLYNFSISSGGSRRFYGQFSNSFCTALNVNEATGVITSSFAYLYDPSAVSFDRNQSSVSDDNKNKALGNIGIDLVRLPYSLLNTTLSDEMMEVVDNARGIILVDTPSDYRNPTVFVKGNNISGSCIFVAFVTGNTYCIFTLNKSTKLLSGISSGLTYGGSVRYAEEQSLTNTQKDTVLSNIGLDFVHVDYSLLNTTLSDADFVRIWNAKGLIVSGNDNLPMIFTRGRSSSEQTAFYAISDSAVMNYMSLLASSKKLSAITSWSYSSGSVRYDMTQSLTNAQIEQVFSNLGVVVAIVEPSDTNGSQLSEARTTQLSNARILLRTETGIPYVLVSNAMNGSSTVYIWAALSSSGTRFDTLIMRVPSTGRGAMGISNIPFRDSTAIKYTKQNLNTAYQEIARSNINVKSVEELLADDDFIAQLKTKLGIA